MDEYVRLVNAALASVALGLWLVRTAHDWRRLPPGPRLLRLSLGLLLATGIYGSIEAHVQGAPMGFRVVLLGVAYVWVIVALTVARRAGGPPRECVRLRRSSDAI